MYGKKEAVMKKKVIVILSIIVLLIAANMVGFYAYADVYYKAGHDAIFASQISTDTVDVSKTKIGGNNALVFAPHNPNPKAGIIMKLTLHLCRSVPIEVYYVCWWRCLLISLFLMEMKH